LNYDSQSVDGETGSTNNQPSAVGEGWSLAGGGYIERTYVSCSVDDGATGAITTSGDLCWKTDNATLNLAGHSSELVRDSTTGTWKLQSDDGSRIEHLVGAAQGCAVGGNGTYDDDCWRLTTTDGTQYYFGLNELPGWNSGDTTTNSAWSVPVFGNDPGEPCNTGTFATSACNQGWRWNLDYVVDVHSNAEALYYAAESNNYAENGGTGAAYTRGGQLDHIDYGLTAGTVYASNAASDRVVFGYDSYGRCNDASHATCTSESLGSPANAAAHPTAYPDVPFDQFCNGTSCPTLLSPSFWTTAMLDTVTTQALSGGSYNNVDVWTLGHSFPDPGDGTNAALWLTQVGHTGYAGGSSLSEPDTIFTGTTMQNRVWDVASGLAPLDKWRIASIKTASGAVISVNYSAQDCQPSEIASILANPQSNSRRCYPEPWSPQITSTLSLPVRQDLFHKYVVTSVISNPETGGGNDQTQETDYVYDGTPAWRYDTSPLTQDKYRTWSQYAGYNTIEVRVGDHNTPAAQQTTVYNFYQGMDGDRANAAGGTKSVSVNGFPGVADSLWFGGQTRETKILNGVGGAVVSDTVNSPWASNVTANDGTNTARMTGDGDTLLTEPVSSGGNQTTDTTTSHDATYGYPMTVNVVTSDANSSCTTDQYTPANTSAWIIGVPDKVLKVARDCAHLSSAVYPQDAISAVRTAYDGLGMGAMPTKGDPTLTEVAESYTGSTPNWSPSTANTTTYDAMGRVTQTKDGNGHATGTAYTPAAGAPAGSGALTSETVTNALSQTDTTTYNPAWGVETSDTDANGELTTATYDPLGRRLGVWQPGRLQASNPTPSIGYAYTLSQTSPNAVATSTLTDSSTTTSYVLYDGLGQQVQTQAPSDATGTTVTDTGYDSAGRVDMTNNAYWTTNVNPSATLFVPISEQNITSKVLTNYDGAGRTTATILMSLAVEQSRTSYAYPGADRTDTTPPAGGTPTSTYTNSLGQQIKLIQYLAATPLGTAPQEATTYQYNAEGKMSAMSDPSGNQWTWAFDTQGRQTSATDPDTGTTTSTYDRAGNVLSTTDARGITLAYSYDSLNRKTGQFVGSTSPTTGTKLASWTYDTVAKGQLSSSTSYVGSTPGHAGLAYTTSVTAYDDGYRPLTSNVIIPTGAPALGGKTYTTTNNYTVYGAILNTTDPAEGNLPSELLRYSYTPNAKLSGIRGNSAIVSSTVYTAIGQIGQYNRSSITATGIDSTYGYDSATGNISEIKETAVTPTAITTVDDRNYTHDAAGNITKAATTSTGATDTQCYSYDYLRDLTAAWTPSSGNCATTPTSSTLGGPAPYWDTYTIDPATGNRTTAVQNPTVSGGTTTTNTYSYPTAATAHPHAVQSVTHTAGTTTTGTDAYGYDASGDTTARPGQTLTYDPAGRVATVTSGGVTQSNIYDASGNLLMQTDPTTGTTLFAGDTEIHVAHGAADSAATAIRTYSLNGTPVAERTDSSTMRWITTDIDGTADMEVLPSTGTITRRYNDPYGNTRGTPAIWSSTHGYLNAPTSTLTALIQLGARAYDPTLGKFLSVDPVLAPTNPQQNNGYAYASNTPVTMSDPSGLCAGGVYSGGHYTPVTTCPDGAASDPVPTPDQSAGGVGRAYVDAAGGGNAGSGAFDGSDNAPGLPDLETTHGKQWVMSHVIGKASPEQIETTGSMLIAGAWSLVMAGCAMVTDEVAEGCYEAAESSGETADEDAALLGEIETADANALAEDSGSSLGDAGSAGVDRGDGRDALGKFTGAGGYGADAEEQGLQDYEDATGLSVERTQVRSSSPVGIRYYDGLAQKPDGTYEGIEVKSGTAMLSKSQQIFDNYIKNGGTATAVLNGQTIAVTSVVLRRVQ
jgi:RHS repeat-associated protein